LTLSFGREIVRAMSKRSDKSRARILAPLPGGTQAKALEKVGSTGLDRLRWLLGLLNRLSDRSAAPTEAERRELEAQVAVFCEPIGNLTGGQNSKLSYTDAMDIGQQFSEAIIVNLGGSSPDINLPPITLTFDRGFKPLYMGAPQKLFPWAIAKLIDTEGHRIAMCARSGCGKLFARRKRGRYCGVKCAQVEHFARYVARHGS